MSMADERLAVPGRFITWREKHISERQFILLLSLVVGVLTAFAAILLKFLIELIHDAVNGTVMRYDSNWLYLVCPLAGIFLSGLFIKYIVRDDIGHGVTKILYALARRNGRIKPHNIWSSLVASAITIGMGGSVGAESPIVLTGSAIGSNIGRMFKMEHKTLMVLIGCGSAGAIAGIFKAPIAGLVFVLEVLMLDLSMGYLLPLPAVMYTYYPINQNQLFPSPYITVYPIHYSLYYVMSHHNSLILCYQQLRYHHQYQLNSHNILYCLYHYKSLQPSNFSSFLQLLDYYVIFP